MDLRKGLALATMAVAFISLCQNGSAQTNQWAVTDLDEFPFDRKPNPATTMNYWNLFFSSAPYGGFAHSESGEITKEARIESNFTYTLVFDGPLENATDFGVTYNKTLSGYRSHTFNDSIGSASIWDNNHVLIQSTHSNPPETPQNFYRNEQCSHTRTNVDSRTQFVSFQTMANTKILSTAGSFVAEASAHCSVIFAFPPAGGGQGGGQ